MPEPVLRYQLCAQLGPSFGVTWDTYDAQPADKLHLLTQLLSRENTAQRRLAEEQARNPNAEYIQLDDSDDDDLTP